MVLENVINITNFSYEIQNLKRSFQRKKKKKILQIPAMKFKIQNIIFNASTKFKIQTLFSTQGNHYKLQLQNYKNHRCYLNVSRNIIT